MAWYDGPMSVSCPKQEQGINKNKRDILQISLFITQTKIGLNTETP